MRTNRLSLAGIELQSRQGSTRLRSMRKKMQDSSEVPGRLWRWRSWISRWSRLLKSAKRMNKESLNFRWILKWSYSSLEEGEGISWVWFRLSPMNQAVDDIRAVCLERSKMTSLLRARRLCLKKQEEEEGSWCIHKRPISLVLRLISQACSHGKRIITMLKN